MVLCAGWCAAEAPVMVVGAAADIQYEDREPGPHPDDIRRWYNTSDLRLDEMIRYWNGREDIDIVMHLGDLINAQWESYDVMLDYVDGTDYNPDLFTFRDLNVPSYQIVGNHEFYSIPDDDHPLGHDDEHVRERLGLEGNRGYYDLLFGNGYRFVILDDQVPEANPTRPDDSFGLGDQRSRYFEDQMDWAREVIADAWLKGEKVVLYQHYPMAKYYNDKPLNTWEAELAAITEGYQNVVAHFSGHYHYGSGKAKNGVLFDILAGTVSADPDKDQNIWYTLEFYDDRVVVDQFGENFYLSPDEDDKTFVYREFATAADCGTEAGCNPIQLGDFNADGSVNAADYTVWRDALNQEVAAFTLADANGDGVISDRDLAAWRTHFGMTLGTPTGTDPVPEPAAAALLLTLLGALSRSSHRSQPPGRA